ncbi:VWA domain-containing protein [Marinobacterium maritimum]|uniref:VWA domain-containing protein n=1 Tax=Marinobacterium maritimum TaxID=500162 RepID=A0ABP3TAG6_9GAMM
MIQFDFPWAWLLFPLPLLAYRWLPPFIEPRRKLRVPFTAAFQHQVQAVSNRSPVGLSRVVLAIRWLLWLLLLAAAARPVLLEPPITRMEPKRDIVLAIDLSLSMSERDVATPDGLKIERLAAVKQAASQFIGQRPDDRIGLVGFGDQAFPLAPPSAEHDTLLQILAMTESGMAGANTALGDAIGVTLKLLANSALPEKVLILLTDGRDNRSRLDPLQAARIARDRSLKIHTIAFGQADSSGANSIAADVLEQIATQTHGHAFLASDQQALQQVYSAIDALTPQNASVLKAQPRRELSWVPVALALGLLLLELLVTALMRRPPVASRTTEQQEADA